LAFLKGVVRRGSARNACQACFGDAPQKVISECRAHHELVGTRNGEGLNIDISGEDTHALRSLGTELADFLLIIEEI
jgi:hypothetical protein